MKNLKVGTRIRLIAMPNDPDPIDKGMTGTVTHVESGSLPQIEVDWDNGRSLSLIPGVDSFEVVEEKDDLRKIAERVIYEKAARCLGYTKDELDEAIDQTGCRAECEEKIADAFREFDVTFADWNSFVEPIASEVAGVVSEHEFETPLPFKPGRR